MPVLNAFELTLTLRVLLAALLGGIIGFYRRHKEAGFRTSALICAGSALFTVLSIHGFAQYGGSLDPSRLAAQVIVGIGFIGAGLIWKHGANVKGITTAASVWVGAGVGIAVGVGYYLLAVAVTAITVLLLILKRYLPWL